MPLLAPCYPWWRYPVKPPLTPSLDYTRRKGAHLSCAPLHEGGVRCLRPREGEGGQQGQAHRKSKEGHASQAEPTRRGPQASASWQWTFHGADKPYDERYTFTEAPKRKARRVRPSFREGWKPDRRQSLPAWRPAKDEVPVTNFDWKPDRQHYFGAWEQQKFVRWTPTPRPIVTDFSHFLGQNSFLQHRVRVLPNSGNGARYRYGANT